MAKVIGLTGGIACGKSAVAERLRSRGCPVVDADAVAREVLAPGSAGLAAVVDAFGEGVLDDQGALSRPALADIVFSDPHARTRLEAITHPRIAALSAERMRDAVAAGAERVFYEAALLVETGRYRDFDALWVVTAPPAVQIDRMLARDGLSRAAAQARLAAQLPMQDKVAVADVIIDNGGDLEALEAQVARALRDDA